MTIQTNEAASLMGVNPVEVVRISQFIQPEIPANGSGSHALYSFRNLVEMQLGRELKQFGLTWRQIRHCVEELRRSRCHWLEEDGVDGWLLTDKEWRWAAGNTIGTAYDAFARNHKPHTFVAINLSVIKQGLRKN